MYQIDYLGDNSNFTFKFLCFPKTLQKTNVCYNYSIFLKKKKFSEENVVKSPLRILPIGSSEKKLTLLKVFEEIYAMLSKMY